MVVLRLDYGYSKEGSVLQIFCKIGYIVTGKAILLVHPMTNVLTKGTDINRVPSNIILLYLPHTHFKNYFQNMLFVEIPEYRNKHIRSPIKVNFYVINGKRKKSQPQHFTYHPGNYL